MAHIDYFKRRCGNTTRQVDEWVQQLFEGNEVTIQDHAHKEGNMANECARRIFLQRLEFEHGLKIGKNSRLQFVGTSKQIFVLLPF